MPKARLNANRCSYSSGEESVQLQGGIGEASLTFTISGTNHFCWEASPLRMDIFKLKPANWRTFASVDINLVMV